jgi:hypothetical protein
MKILFNYPSRNRPERFFDGLTSIVDNTCDMTAIHVLGVFDEDDPSMNNPDTIARMKEYSNFMSWKFGTSTGKINAVNRDFMQYPDPWDIIINMSDDMRFTLYGFDQMIRDHMHYYFPELDGLLHYPDSQPGANRGGADQLNTLYIAGRKYARSFGYIYHPAYHSLFADNESMDVAKLLNRYVYINERMHDHLLPQYGGLPEDAMFRQQQDYWDEDLATYNQRKANNFDLKL